MRQLTGLIMVLAGVAMIESDWRLVPVILIVAGGFVALTERKFFKKL